MVPFARSWLPADCHRKTGLRWGTRAKERDRIGVFAHAYGSGEAGPRRRNPKYRRPGEVNRPNVR